MSSSEPGRRFARFFAAFGAGLAGTIAVLATAMLVVDPLGATGGNPVCPAGAKVAYNPGAEPLVAERTRPRTIVLGTSRVKLAFGRDALAILGEQPVANLGIIGGFPADFANLAEDALAGDRLERAVIGVDFNMVHQPAPVGPDEPIAKARFPRLERLRLAFLSYPALRGLPSALLDCRPLAHPDGAPVLGADHRPRLPVPGPLADQRAQVMPLLDPGARPDASLFAERKSELRALLRRLRERGVDVVLFSAPYREELVAMFGEAGLGGEFDAFHRDIARLAKEEDVPFVDLHGGAGIAALNLPRCPGGGIGCHYLDLTHYAPLVGERIAQRLATSPAGSSDDSPRPPSRGPRTAP